LTEIRDLNAELIPLGRLAFFREQLKHQLHQLVLRKFLSLQDAKGFTKKDLARRIHRKPEQVTRWLGAPGNLTLDTVSDLLIGMAAVLDLDAIVVDIDDLVREREVKPQIPANIPASILSRLGEPRGMSGNPKQPVVSAPQPLQGQQHGIIP
jgi:hypothetical protein